MFSYMYNTCTFEILKLSRWMTVYYVHLITGPRGNRLYSQEVEENINSWGKTKLNLPVGISNYYKWFVVYLCFIVLSNETWKIAFKSKHIIFIFISGEMQLHLQAMVNLLRDEDVLRLVRLIIIVSIFVMSTL